MATIPEGLVAALADRYRLTRELGAGGMATVYLAEDLKHPRQVAVKVLRPDLAATLGPDRFIREVGIAARLSHPHIVGLLDSGEAAGFLYYVMPYVEGTSLRQKLVREGELPIPEAVRILRDVADALAYAHGQGVVHRDVKPENIMLVARHALVMDFGVAKALAEGKEEGASSLTSAGVALGTPAYMAPEQASGDLHVDYRADLYAWGIVAYELLAGQPPFVRNTPQKTLAAQVTAAPEPVSHHRANVPGPLAHLVMQCLEKKAADRPQSAEEVLRQLDQVLTPSGGMTPTDTRPYQTASTRRARRRALAVAAGVVVVLGLAGWGLWRRFQAPPSEISSLVVLPLRNASGDSGRDYIADGVHESVIGELARIGSLRVISAFSAQRYRNTDKSLGAIAGELGVQGVVQASVEVAGDTMHLRAELIQALPEERTLGSWSYDYRVQDVARMQRELAHTIARQLNATITPEEAIQLHATRQVKPAAYEAWLKAVRAYSSVDYRNCASHAKEAVAIDPAYAQGYAQLASCFTSLAYITAAPPAPIFAEAKASARRALELDEFLPEAHAALAYVLTAADWNWPEAERAYRRALEVGPGSDAVHRSYGFQLAWVGRFDEAIEHTTRAAELNPLHIGSATGLAMVLYFARRFDDAVAQARRAVERDSTVAFAWDRLRFAYSGKGMYPEALEAAKRAAALGGPNDVRRRGFLAYNYGLAGQKKEALAIVQELLALERKTYVPPIGIAAAYVGLGDRDQVIHWLTRAYEERDADMYLVKYWPLWDPVRDDPRFQELVRRLGYPQS
jgi:serine/threonine protein kinase/tetratricopeptide (TPR) repeat protein